MQEKNLFEPVFFLSRRIRSAQFDIDTPGDDGVPHNVTRAAETFENIQTRRLEIHEVIFGVDTRVEAHSAVGKSSKPAMVRNQNDITHG